MTTDYMNNTYVPLWEKELLNVPEATAFSGIRSKLDSCSY